MVEGLAQQPALDSPTNEMQIFNQNRIDFLKKHSKSKTHDLLMHTVIILIDAFFIFHQIGLTN